MNLLFWWESESKFLQFFVAQAHYAPQNCKNLDSLSPHARYDCLSPTDS